jgi:hypothetical protein
MKAIGFMALQRTSMTVGAQQPPRHVSHFTISLLLRPPLLSQIMSYEL